ncbi:MAG: UbiH/UbiF/VisC/COQ6 family ubiquinone biosynthesis hydroxylase [Alphaproteobacteria bacterium]
MAKPSTSVPSSTGPRQRADASAVESEVLIVGGGMVGLTLASALGGAGLSVCVVDREDPATVLDGAFDARASAIAFGSQRVLQALGLWPRLERDAQPILDIRVTDGDSSMFLHFDHRDLGDAPFGYIVENQVIRRALFDHVRTMPSVRIHAPVTLASLAREKGHVQAMLGDGRKLKAAVAIGADGRHSRLREEAGIATTNWSYPQTGIVCTVAHSRPHHGVAHERFLPAGPFAILPMTPVTRDGQVRHRSSIVWTERAHLAPALLRLSEGDFNAELAKRFGGYLGALQVLGRRWSFALALMHAESYIAHRLALVGDAAHAIHPIAGQGLNMGLRDVAAAAEVLVDARRLGLDIGDVSVLERYQRWRRFDNLVFCAATDGLNRLFSNDLAPLRLARDLGLAAVNRLGPLRRFFMRQAMGVLGELPRLVRGEPL